MCIPFRVTILFLNGILFDFKFKHILFPIYTYDKHFNLQNYKLMVLKGWLYFTSY